MIGICSCRLCRVLSQRSKEEHSQMATIIGRWKLRHAVIMTICFALLSIALPFAPFAPEGLSNRSRLLVGSLMAAIMVVSILAAYAVVLVLGVLRIGPDAGRWAFDRWAVVAGVAALLLGPTAAVCAMMLAAPERTVTERALWLLAMLACLAVFVAGTLRAGRFPSENAQEAGQADAERCAPPLRRSTVLRFVLVFLGFWLALVVLMRQVAQSPG